MSNQTTTTTTTTTSTSSSSSPSPPPVSSSSSSSTTTSSQSSTSTASPNVSFVLLSEFDILKGAQLKHQLPGPTGIKESQLAEAMLPEGSHLRESDWNVFVITLQNTPHCVLNLVRTKMDRSVARGAVVKSLAVVTCHRFYNVFRPLLMLALDQYLEVSSWSQAQYTQEQIEHEQTNILTQLYHALECMELSLPTISPLYQRVARAQRLRASPFNEWTTTCVKWGPATLPLRIPTHMEQDEVLEASVMTLVNRFQENIMLIYNAILCEKRVLFLGYQQPANDVCNCVVSACLLISPPLFGTLSRAHPYANLTCLDFLSVQGYIAGVTNPIFESRKEWWDVLCNITNGEVILAPNYQAEMENNEKQSQLDSSFFHELITGVQLKYGEEWARCAFRDYTAHIISLCREEEIFPDANTRSWHMDANRYRINQLLKSSQLQRHHAAMNVLASTSPLGPQLAITRNHLRILQLHPPAEPLHIYNHLLTHVNTRDEILELLSFLNESQGGLFPLAQGLFHRTAKVRDATVELLQRIDKQAEGNKAVSGLNYFLLMTYYRYLRQEGNQDQDFELTSDSDDDFAAAASHDRDAPSHGVSFASKLTAEMTGAPFRSPSVPIRAPTFHYSSADNSREPTPSDREHEQADESRETSISSINITHEHEESADNIQEHKQD